MSGPRTIHRVFQEDHERLDVLFQSFRSLKRSDFVRAKDAFKAFKTGLQRHIVWEEDLLFPLWEEKTGLSDGGPSAVMRAEHRRIGDQLEALHLKVAAQEIDSDPEEEALSGLLASHNRKEERVLYPALDQISTPEERETIYRKMGEIPEERYRACCGLHEA